MRNCLIYLIISIFYFNNIFSKYTIENGIVMYNGVSVTRDLEYPFTTNADVKSFKVIDGIYAKDKYAVYRYGNYIIGADPQTFIPLNHGFSKDKNNIYRYNWIVGGIDKNTFKVLNQDENEDKYGIYFSDKNGIYFIKVWERNPYSKLEDIDIKTFEVLKNGYAKDKNNIYYNSFIIEEADMNSFEILSSDFSKDKNYFYFDGGKIKNIDVKTVKFFEKSFDSKYYLKDKNGVYIIDTVSEKYKITKLKSADIETFEILKEGYTKDKNSLYFYDYKLNVNPKTVEIFKMENDYINIYYLKDKNGIYVIIKSEIFPYEYKITKLENVDIKTFEILSEGNARDKNFMYIFDKKNKTIDIRKN